MLRAPALRHPNMIQTWKCKLGQQRRLGLAGSRECHPSSFPPGRHPLRKGPCPGSSAKNRTEGLCVCLRSSFIGVAACVQLFFCNASVWREACHSLELSSSSCSHGAAKVAGATLLCSHRTRAETTAAPSLSTPAYCDRHVHVAFYLLDLDSLQFCPPPSPTTWERLKHLHPVLAGTSKSPHRLKLVLERQLSSRR